MVLKYQDLSKFDFKVSEIFKIELQIHQEHLSPLVESQSLEMAIPQSYLVSLNWVNSPTLHPYRLRLKEVKQSIINFQLRLDYDSVHWDVVVEDYYFEKYLIKVELVYQGFVSETLLRAQ